MSLLQLLHPPVHMQQENWWKEFTRFERWKTLQQKFNALTFIKGT